MWTVLNLLILSIKLILKWWPFYDSIFSQPTYGNVISFVHFQILKSEILF